MNQEPERDMQDEEENEIFEGDAPENEAEDPEGEAIEPPSPEGRIAQLESDLAATKDQMMRALAEAENARKRAERLREEGVKYAVADFAKEILNVSDNLRRALDSVPEDQRSAHDLLENLLIGVEATERELLSAFDKFGVQKIEPLEEACNPNFHEVMFEIDNPDAKPGTVLKVLEPGYVIKDRLLRPARVGVAKNGRPKVDEDA